jgi:hypothetical protein
MRDARWKISGYNGSKGIVGDRLSEGAAEPRVKFFLFSTFLAVFNSGGSVDIH